VTVYVLVFMRHPVLVS